MCIKWYLKLCVGSNSNRRKSFPEIRIYFNSDSQYCVLFGDFQKIQRQIYIGHGYKLFILKRVIIGSHQCGLLNSMSLHWLTMKTGFNQRYWNGDHSEPNSVKCARKIRNTLNKRVNKSEKRKHYCHLPKPEGIIKHCKCTFFLIEKLR